MSLSWTRDIVFYKSTSSITLPVSQALIKEVKNYNLKCQHVQHALMQSHE